MLNPSKTGWIKKYFSLAERGAFAPEVFLENILSSEKSVIQFLAESGIIFGVFGQFIFLKGQGEEEWTTHEKLKVLYLESLLVIYKHTYPNQKNLNVFLETVESFYEDTSSREIKKIWSINRWFNLPKNIERTITKRTQIPLTFNQQIMVSYLQNSLCFIDVILFERYLLDRSSQNWPLYRAEKIKLTLAVLVYSFQADGYIDESERQLFNLFLASADIESQEKEKFEQILIEGVALADLKPARQMGSFFKNYLFQLSVFSMLSDTEFSSRERKVLNELSVLWDLSTSEINNSYELVEQFAIEHEEIITKLKSKGSYDQIFSRLSKKWSKLFLRNKDKLTIELKESTELVALVKKSMSQPLNTEEKSKVKSQFFDIVKTVPSLAIFMLPGGAFILPFILKVLPDLIPSAFRDNVIEDDEKK